MTMKEKDSKITVKKEKKENILTEEAFALFNKDPRIYLTAVAEAFPGRPEKKGPVTERMYVLFRNKWIKNNGTTKYPFTRNASREYNRRNGRKFISVEEILKETGKDYGVTVEEVTSILNRLDQPLAPDARKEYMQRQGFKLISYEKILEETGKDFGVTLEEVTAILDRFEREADVKNDGDPTKCFVGHHMFQPQTKFILGSKSGKRVKGHNGEEILIGNFLGIENSKDDGKFIIVALCTQCRGKNKELRQVPTHPQKVAQAFVDRRNKVVTDREDATRLIVESNSRVPKNRNRNRHRPKRLNSETIHASKSESNEENSSNLIQQEETGKSNSKMVYVSNTEEDIDLRSN